MSSPAFSGNPMDPTFSKKTYDKIFYFPMDFYADDSNSVLPPISPRFTAAELNEETKPLPDVDSTKIQLLTDALSGVSIIRPTPRIPSIRPNTQGLSTNFLAALLSTIK